MDDEKKPEFLLSISLNVLDHLGINLYSNVPSVLSEIVANAWDADATEVSVIFKKEEKVIIIKDNGIGMSKDDVNNRFLCVGYQRREGQSSQTGLGREPMGRKGIGKLSLFSIAGVIEVFTAKDGHKSAFKMVREDIREAIKGKNKGYYAPEILPVDEIDFENGTLIRLSNLLRLHTIRTPQALKKRIARRFSIIGTKENFHVSVNNDKITPADRDYYNKLQFLWTYGDQSEVIPLCTKLLNNPEVNNPEDRSAALQENKIELTGWIGTVHDSSQLRDSENEEHLNKLAIFVRGKMAQEDILSDFSEQGVYASYLIGELHADFLDVDDEEDAATSNRQKFVEDDQRYIELKGFIKNELNSIKKKWTGLRTDEGARRAMRIPEIETWIKHLPKLQQSMAKSWIGRIYRLQTTHESERRELLKHSVLAFEFHRTNENIAALEKINDENLQEVISIFKDIDTLEEAFYGQIVKQRIGVIKAFQEKIDDNNKESVIQSYLFNHLWLLDPSWERIDGSSPLMESRVSTLFENVDADLTEEERLARIDIKYRKSAGTHVVVELKRPERLVSIHDLTQQIDKYRSGMLKILNDLDRANEPVVFVVLLGRRPKQWENLDGPKTVTEALKNYGARFVLYDELIDNAFSCYSDYKNRSENVQDLEKIINAIDQYASDV